MLHILSCGVWRYPRLTMTIIPRTHDMIRITAKIWGFHPCPVCHLSTEFCESRWSCLKHNTGNKQTNKLTDTGESITFLAAVTGRSGVLRDSAKLTPARFLSPLTLTFDLFSPKITLTPSCIKVARQSKTWLSLPQSFLRVVLWHSG